MKRPTSPVLAAALLTGSGGALGAHGSALGPLTVELLERGVAGGDVAFLREHVAENYVQHNPVVPDGQAGLIGFVESLDGAGGLEIDVRRVLVDGELAAVHSLSTFGGTEMAAFDVFRFADGIAVEHWDAHQPLVEETASGRTMLDGPTEVDRNAPTDANRALVESFVSEVLVGGAFDRLPEFIGEEYRQHNPQIRDGLDGVASFVQSLADEGVSFAYGEHHLSVADGQFVLTLSEGEIGGTPTAFHDLWRVENGRIVEHWDVVRDIPETMAHGNGMF